MFNIFIHLLTFSKNSAVSRLTDWEDRLDEDAHTPLGRVNPAHHTEAQPLLAWPLLKVDVVQGHRHRLGPRGRDTARPAAHASRN